MRIAMKVIAFFLIGLSVSQAASNSYTCTFRGKRDGQVASQGLLVAGAAEYFFGVPREEEIRGERTQVSLESLNSSCEAVRIFANLDRAVHILLFKEPSRNGREFVRLGIYTLQRYPPEQPFGLPESYCLPLTSNSGQRANLVSLKRDRNYLEEKASALFEPGSAIELRQPSQVSSALNLLGGFSISCEPRR